MYSSSDSIITPPDTPVWFQPSNDIPSPSSTFSRSPSSSSANFSPRHSISISPKSSFSSISRATSIKEHVQVMVRCRPKSAEEMEMDEDSCWIISPQNGTIELNNPNSTPFNYDNVLMGVNNADVYQSGIADLVRSAMMGYNGTVFAYGQTASGKTYTMTGTHEEPGIIPRAIDDVFKYIQEDTNGREYLLRVSYLEIYNEKIQDLLNVSNKNPDIYEDKAGIHVHNLKEIPVKTPDDIMKCIKNGEKNRHISSTDYNSHSSRSHTIFQLIIESKSKGTSSYEIRLSRLNLIDLAGSEKAAADKDRRKEGHYINQSLLSLGNVISKLTTNNPGHIPYRGSKLTRLLQTSLSGDARIAMICTINPTLASKNESLNTLRFAQRAKLIKTAAKMTKIFDHSELQNYVNEIADLRKQMQEKNDLEAETKDRLKNLLSMILTSSKPQDKDKQLEIFNISNDDLSNDATMRDVISLFEEGLVAQTTAYEKETAAYRRENSAHKREIERLKDMNKVMQLVLDKQTEQLERRDSQIKNLNQELTAAKSGAFRTSKSPFSKTCTHIPTRVTSATPIITGISITTTNTNTIDDTIVGTNTINTESTDKDPIDTITSATPVITNVSIATANSDSIDNIIDDADTDIIDIIDDAETDIIDTIDDAETDKIDIIDDADTDIIDNIIDDEDVNITNMESIDTVNINISTSNISIADTTTINTTAIESINTNTDNDTDTDAVLITPIDSMNVSIADLSEDLAPAFNMAAQRITEAIVSGLPIENGDGNLDKEKMSKSLFSAIQASITDSVYLQEDVGFADITLAISKVVKQHSSQFISPSSESTLSLPLLDDSPKTDSNRSIIQPSFTTVLSRTLVAILITMFLIYY